MWRTARSTDRTESPDRIWSPVHPSLLGPSTSPPWRSIAASTGYLAHGKYGKIFSKVEGKLWIDKQDLGWIKVDGQVIQPGLDGIVPGPRAGDSHILMEQTRLADGIWERIEVRASAKIFFVKSLVIDKILTYSDYRLAQTGAYVTVAPLTP